MKTLYETRRRWAVMVAVVALGLTAFAAARASSGTAAQAVTVTCGQTLTTSTTVGNDLTNCPGDGLVIGAAGITVNLNGHTIDGAFAGVGIRNDSFANVTIENGTVTAFARGIELAQPTENNRLEDLRVSAHAISGVLASGAATVVTGIAAFDNGSFGIRIQGAGSSVTGTATNNNATFGIITDGTGTTLNGNRALANGASGIAMSAGASATKATDNIANGNDVHGIFAADPTAVLSKNTASFNTELGIGSMSGGVTDGGGNKAAGNGSVHQCENVVCTAP